MTTEISKFPPLDSYVCYKVYLVAEDCNGNCKKVDDLCPDAYDHFWTLYGYNIDGCSIAIYDAPTKRQIIDMLPSFGISTDRLQPTHPDVDPLATWGVDVDNNFSATSKGTVSHDGRSNNNVQEACIRALDVGWTINLTLSQRVSLEQYIKNNGETSIKDYCLSLCEDSNWDICKKK